MYFKHYVTFNKATEIDIGEFVFPFPILSWCKGKGILEQAMG